MFTDELGERFPSGVNFCCATPSPITIGVLAFAAIEVAELRSLGGWVDGARAG